MNDYTVYLRDDLLEQFKEQPNIESLIQVIGKQLQDVYEFLEDLSALRWIDSAKGIQLDRVGDIVVLSRAEALKLLGRSGTITDDEYRYLLKYKIFRNSVTPTYPDMMRAIRTFWTKPLYYGEKPENPATIFLKTDPLSDQTDIETVVTIPVPKPAGVQLAIELQNPTKRENLACGMVSYTVQHIKVTCEKPGVTVFVLVDENGNQLLDEYGNRILDNAL